MSQRCGCGAVSAVVTKGAASIVGLFQDARRVVEELVDREAARNEALPHRIVDDDLERGLDRLIAEAYRGRLLAIGRLAHLRALGQQTEYLFHDVGPRFDDRL